MQTNGTDHGGSDEEESQNIGEDRIEVDETGTGGRRLRQAPAQRVPFQPDASSSRQTRQSVGRTTSPAPSSNLYSQVNGTQNGSSLSASLSNYDPRAQLPLTLKVVNTPGNNPDMLKASQDALRNAVSQYPKSAAGATKGMMLPGTGFVGHNIYLRTLLSLQSGVVDEEEYALHHLIKISHERGDKYRFENFVGLAEALIEKILSIASLFYEDVEWKIVYHEEELTSGYYVLDGVNGTSDVLNKIINSRLLPIDGMESEDVALRLRLINSAGLVLRNMVLLHENSEYLQKYPTVRDLIVIVLNLPSLAQTSEIQQYALDVAEQMTPYYDLESDDPLVISLTKHTLTSDRSFAVSSLRAISRLGILLEDDIRPQEIPVSTLRNICEWLLIDDESLQNACLEILYRFTTFVSNVELLLANTKIDELVAHVVRLLLHGARHEIRKEPGSKGPVKAGISKQPLPPPLPPPPVDMPIPSIPRDLVDTLLGYTEPDRSSQWLNSCFIEDKDGEITQLELWKAYQIPFAPFGNQRPLLPAKDFITNVSSTFKNASAQVIGPSTAESKARFVIKGIRPRKVPVEPKGRAYMRCLWHLDDGQECGAFALWPKYMWNHVVNDHLRIKTEEGRYDVQTASSELTHSCRWADCQRFSIANGQQAVSAYEVGMHVKTHLPDGSEQAYQRSKYNKVTDADVEMDNTADSAVSQPSMSWSVQTTPVDESNHAMGVPLSSALLLRNLARNMLKARLNTGNKLTRSGKELVWKVFGPVREQLYFVLAHNYSLTGVQPLDELMARIDAAAPGVEGAS